MTRPQQESEQDQEPEQEMIAVIGMAGRFPGAADVAELWRNLRAGVESIRRFTAAVNSPLVIDSTETPVIEAALKLHGGKPIINSINFEDGEKHAADRLKLARQFGACVIALTIDETGMAKTAQAKLDIARRLVDFAWLRVGEHADRGPVFRFCFEGVDDQPRVTGRDIAFAGLPEDEAE